jgi:hypothetical protein
LIFNAPRPLWGTREWEGDFLHGIFYVAVDPTDARAEMMIKQNAELDGWLCEYVTMEQVRAWAAQIAAERGYDRKDVDSLSDQDLQNWYLDCNWRTSGTIPTNRRSDNNGTGN